MLSPGLWAGHLLFLGTMPLQSSCNEAHFEASGGLTTRSRIAPSDTSTAGVRYARAREAAICFVLSKFPLTYLVLELIVVVMAIAVSQRRVRG